MKIFPEHLYLKKIWEEGKRKNLKKFIKKDYCKYKGCCAEMYKLVIKYICLLLHYFVLGRFVILVVSIIANGVLCFYGVGKETPLATYVLYTLMGNEILYAVFYLRMKVNTTYYTKKTNNKNWIYNNIIFTDNVNTNMLIQTNLFSISKQIGRVKRTIYARLLYIIAKIL